MTQSYRGIDYRILRGPHTNADISRGALLWHAVYEVNGKGYFILDRRSQKDLVLRLEQAIDLRLLPKPAKVPKRSLRIEKLRRMTVANGRTAAEAATALRKLHRMSRQRKPRTIVL